MVDVFGQSIVDADGKLGATVWSPTPDVSLIEPRGNEQGWEQISSVFYVKTIGEMFTKRLLKVVRDTRGLASALACLRRLRRRTLTQDRPMQRRKQSCAVVEIG
jgi:hypothetical protein